jgi:hypothetical protein
MKRAQAFPPDPELLTRQDAVLEGDPAIYLFGIAKRDGMIESAVPFVDGIAPNVPVEVFPMGQFAVIASRAPETAFDVWAGETARDPETDRALAHHRILANLSMFTAIAPAKVGTIVRNLDGVYALLVRSGPHYAQMIDRVAGSQEWGVELFADIAFCHKVAERNPAVVALAKRIVEASPDKAPLLRKQCQEIIAQEARHGLSGRVDVIHRFISARARMTAVSRLVLGADWDGSSPMLVLDSAYLVERSRETEFRQIMAGLIKAVEPEGFQLKLSGPWPAYSFISIAQKDVTQKSK